MAILYTTHAICPALTTTTFPTNFNGHSVTRSSTTTRHLLPTTPGRRSSTSPSVVGYCVGTSTRPVLTTRRSTYMKPQIMRYSTTNIRRPVLAMCASSTTGEAEEIKRSDFPKDFIFGVGSASYQIEGAVNQGGRGPSIWDTFTHEFPEKIADGSNGNVAIDSFHRYKEDVHIMKNLGVNAYRLSISWSRILPTGKLSGGISREGIEYYNNVINELIENGIAPYVTLFHWDLPQALHDEYGGFSSEKIVDDFCDYANLCFWEFGDRVKNWITLNEPWSYAVFGHQLCAHPPGGLYPWYMHSKLNMYDVTHNFLLAHANAAALYKKNYQKVQKGKMGIVLVTCWYESYDKDNAGAGERETDFMLGWYMDPLINGKYPNSVIERVKDLRVFTEDQQKLLKESYDFIGINYYTAYYALDKNKYQPPPNGFDDDYVEPFIYHPLSDVLLTSRWRGKSIGDTAHSWINVCPRGFEQVLINIKNKYNNPLIYITENGLMDKDEVKGTTLQDVCNDDTTRLKYLQDHLLALKKVRDDDKVNIMAYFVWCLMDNFEWTDGYLTRFGLVYVDYKNNLGRFPKNSALWYMNFLKGESDETPKKEPSHDHGHHDHGHGHHGHHGQGRH
ncbi:beta-glucosidase 13-like [Cornus florida]|uniref:beta-glucosidase 13-like n=1 Tax=Cornus florida TaxID=4283 RepID=UPI00289AAD97|nr:beta-glucosidase 13-like [Cornus florida]